MIKNHIKNILKHTPFISKIFKLYFDFWDMSCFEPGHFYSPIVNMDDVDENKWSDPKAPIGINLNDNKQLELLNKLSLSVSHISFVNNQNLKKRYYSNNTFFIFTDAIILNGMMNLFSPSKIIEVGSGFSSALMLDVLEDNHELKTHLCFIEPFPDRLNSLIRKQDRIKTTIIEEKVQKISLSTFQELTVNDILFIDSSHVSKTGSDLNYILFEILPNLKKGVIIHFHDVFYPFEYPLEWVKSGRNWNEDYLLKAFLMYNTDFEILFFNDYMHRFHSELMKDKLPYKEYSSGGSLWMQKTI